MALGYPFPLRNIQLDCISTSLGNAAKMRIYDGVRPATGGAATTKLAELTMGSPFAPALGSTGTVVLLPTLPGSSTALASGTASWARIVKADGTSTDFFIDLTVTGTGSGGDIGLNTTIIGSGAIVTVSSASITAGNA
jgi:hypothetical protein